MFEPLSEKETKELTFCTCHIANLLHNMAAYIPVPSWYRKHNLDPNKITAHFNKLNELLGEHTYGTHGEGKSRMLVWGRSWNATKYPNNKFVVYCDNRGLSIELHPKFRKDQINKFLKTIIKVLYGK
jgi:hypothetical protein